MSEFTETYKLTEIHFKLLSPVIKHEYELTPSIISLLEKQLRGKLEFQLDYYLKAGPDTERFIINFIQKPEVNWVTRAPTWPRIRNSLEQFRQLVLKEGTQNENILKFPREPLLKLIYIDEKTNNETIFHWTTTAALLVVQAILYSHREWTRPFHHDIWSAGQARKDLVAIGIPENFADKVAIMIAFQNLFRNGLKERPTEVGVWFGFDEFKSIKTKEETGVERRLKTKIEGLNDQWQRLNDIKNDLSRQRNYETRPEEKIRQQSLIDEKESELEKVENELTRHERELANIQNGNFDQLGDNIGFSQASAPVRNALAREIFKQWIGPDPVLWKENEKSTALSALGACTLCHDRRSTRQLLNPDDDFIDKYNAFLNLYDRIKHENFTVEKTILCGFEFTNYVFEGFEWNISFRQFATMVLNRLQGINLDKTSMILFSFGRFWSNREITNFRDKLPNYVGCFKVEDPRIQTLLQEVLLDSCGEIRFAHLVLEKDELFKLFFSEEEIELLMDDKENLSEGVWKWVGKAIEWIRLRRPWKYNGDDYLPFGAVDRVLRVLAKIHPTYFTTGRFTWRDPMPETGIMSRGSTITVPIKPPSEEELEECVSQENYFDPKLIVARYAAVAILNQRMAYGPGSLEFTFGPIPDEKNIDDWEWYKVINWIEEKNYHNTLKCYLDQVYSPFYANFVKLPDIAIAELPSNPLALCVDVGAGDVKVELWSVSCNDGKLQLEKALRQKTYKTSLGEGRRYQDAEKFAEILKNQIYPDDASDDKFLELANKSLIVIGIAWPGAVQGEPGAEYVAGPLEF